MCLQNLYQMWGLPNINVFPTKVESLLYFWLVSIFRLFGYQKTLKKDAFINTFTTFVGLVWCDFSPHVLVVCQCRSNRSLMCQQRLCQRWELIKFKKIELIILPHWYLLRASAGTNCSAPCTWTFSWPCGWGPQVTQSRCHVVSIWSHDVCRTCLWVVKH